MPGNKHFELIKSCLNENRMKKPSFYDVVLLLHKLNISEPFGLIKKYLNDSKKLSLVPKKLTMFCFNIKPSESNDSFFITG